MSLNLPPQPTEAAEAPVRRLLMEALVRKLKDAGASTAGIDETTPLVDLGVIDSQALLDLILEVEDDSGRIFDPLLIDFDGDVTLARIAMAFTSHD